MLDRLAQRLEGFSPQVRVAASYVIDHPSQIAVTSMRRLAEAAGVQPNTMVRMARSVGFGGYEQFREPFRAAAAKAAPSFPDRARWLQSINGGGRHGELLARMAAACLGNVEALYQSLDAHELKAAADLILAARRTYVLGVGTAQSLAENFCYVASMIGVPASAIPGRARLAIDDIGEMSAGDVLVSVTFAPYRTETVEATRLAAARSASVIAISDSRAAPICTDARHVFAVGVDTPQYFVSVTAAAALLETLLAFMAADTSVDAAAALAEFHLRRHEAGVYTG